jgi:hypothetical protein
MRTCEYEPCGKPLSGRRDKRFHDTCRALAWQQRKRDEAFFSRLHEWSAEDEAEALRAYEEAEAGVLERVRWKRRRRHYDAEWEWARFRVANLTDDPTKPFREQDELVQRDARDVPN